VQHYNATLTLPPPSVDNKVREICSFIGEGKLCTMFKKVRAVVLLASCKLLTAGVQCFPNTLETTTQMLHDGTTWVITGDIPLMWMRDSSAQVNQYLPLAPSDPYIQIIIEGLIRRQIRWIHLDPYGSSYRLFHPNTHPQRAIGSARSLSRSLMRSLVPSLSLVHRARIASRTGISSRVARFTLRCTITRSTRCATL